ncbi:unnamed protein product [Soboliphyme baturini]|uniref:RME-8_N domain-containing protein n=1 Tax=Soboliphyme baturini TaxID=241478 RepID=A0A183IPP8_9BILA|nr:unnamed protein product [Soboliphyme baturini]
MRWVPLWSFLDEEAESQQMKFIASSNPPVGVVEAVKRFNWNVNYSGLIHSVSQEGLFAENKEKLIVNCLMIILDSCHNLSAAAWEQVFLALRKLFASKAGFSAFYAVPRPTHFQKCALCRLREMLGSAVMIALKLNDDGVSQVAIDALCALMHPLHDNYELKVEQMNKWSLLSSRKFVEHILDMFCFHVRHGTGALVVTSVLDFLTFALCMPYGETTPAEQFDMVLELLVARARTLYKLFEYPSLTIVKGAGLVIQAMIEVNYVTLNDIKLKFSLSMIS